MTLLLSLLLTAAPAIQVEGALVKSASLTVKDLQELGPVTTDWTDKRGAHKVTGVRLDKVLLKLGFTEGPTGPQADPKVKHQGLRGAVIATAADGFEAVFSIGELLETLGATIALLVWEVDGGKSTVSRSPPTPVPSASASSLTRACRAHSIDSPRCASSI